MCASVCGVNTPTLDDFKPQHGVSKHEVGKRGIQWAHESRYEPALVTQLVILARLAPAWWCGWELRGGCESGGGESEGDSSFKKLRSEGEKKDRQRQPGFEGWDSPW